MKMTESMIIEKRDLDFILSAYLRSYLFYNQNESPEKITIPMINEVRNFRDGKLIPVEFVEYMPEASTVAPEDALLQSPK